MKKLFVIIVMMLLWIGLNAQENDLIGKSSHSSPDHKIYVETEEIGVPYIKKGSGQVDSAVLAPNGESFYTLKGSLITHFQIEPFKKLESFDTHFKWKNKMDNERKNKSQLFVTADGQKLIGFHNHEIVLWNLETKNMMGNVILEEGSVGTLIDETFITIDKHYKITAWDSNTLQKKTEMLFNDSYPYPYEDEQISGVLKALPIGGLYTISGELVYMTANASHTPAAVMLLDKKTLRVKKIFATIGIRVFLSNDLVGMEHVGAVFNVELNKEEHHGYMKTIRYDLRKNRFTDDKPRISKNINPMNTSSVFSFKDKYVLFKSKLSGRNELNIFDSKEKIKSKRRKQFYQFNEGEALLKGLKGKFEATSNVKKYMKMKTFDDRIVSITDGTYKNYLNRGLINE